jgi:hypothetical protein
MSGSCGSVSIRSPRRVPSTSALRLGSSGGPSEGKPFDALPFLEQFGGSSQQQTHSLAFVLVAWAAPESLEGDSSQPIVIHDVACHFSWALDSDAYDS